MQSPWSLQRLCLCTFTVFSLRNNFVSRNFRPGLTDASAILICLSTTLLTLTSSCMNGHLGRGQVRAAGNWPVLGLARESLLSRAPSRVTRLSISHAKYTRSPSQQPQKQRIMSSVQLSHSQPAGGNISFMPDLGLEIPRIKIHFRLHFLF